MWFLCGRIYCARMACVWISEIKICSASLYIRYIEIMIITSNLMLLNYRRTFLIKSCLFFFKSLKSVTSDTTWNYPDKYFQRFHFCLILQNVYMIDKKRLSAKAMHQDGIYLKLFSNIEGYWWFVRYKLSSR